MSKLVALALAALALGACQKEPAPPQSAAPLAVPVNGKPGVPEPAAGSSKVPLTAEKLASYLQYQQRMLEAYSRLIKEVKAMDLRRDAGERAAARDAVTSIERKDSAEVAAREALGLSEEEVEVLDALVADVVMKREVAKAMNLEGMVKQMEQMRAQLPKDAQAGLDRSLADARVQVQQMSQLSIEREKYGSANVDLVLTKEAQLVKNHERLMNLWVSP